MKLLKKLFYGIAIIIMIACAGMLIVAFSPGMSESVSKILYGEDGSRLPHKGDSSDQDPAEESGTSAAIFGDTSGIADGVLASGDSASYVAPLRGSLNLPDQVAGKNGYEPVTGSGEELAEEQADELGLQIGTGETGDGLTFDALMYPYYHMLNPQMKHVYRQIYANALVLKDSFAPVEKVNTAQIRNVFEAVYDDHPELFWLETEYTCKYRADRTCVEIVLAYNRTAQNLEQSKTEFQKQAQSILSGATQNDLRGKETYVHDALLKQADYVVSAAMNQSAYSALVNGDTVCAGYSRAFQYLMQQLGVPCYYCTGYSGEDHAWNIIQLEGGYYNVDATWDDTNPPTYNYFNKTDADFVGTHVRTGLSVYLPPCGNISGADEGSGATSQVEPDRPGGITLNPNPQQPLTWVPKEEEVVDPSGITVSGNEVYDRGKAGISENEALWTLQEYYDDCLRQMQKVGSGQKTFSNVVPKCILTLVEQSYGTGAYYKQYAEEGLKKLKQENFAIQIQVQELGGNYYRLYHNISTW